MIFQLQAIDMKTKVFILNIISFENKQNLNVIKHQALSHTASYILHLSVPSKFNKASDFGTCCR